jgi:predicted ATPase
MPSPERMIVRGFKSILEMDLRLRPLNVLIGANGAGKSNFVGVFRLLNQIVEGSVQTFVGKAGGASSLLFRGSPTSDRVEIEIDFASGGYQATLAQTSDDSLIFVSESCSVRGARMPPMVIPLGEGHSESRLRSYPERYSQAGVLPVLEALRGCRTYHFHDTSDRARLKLTHDLGDNAALRPDASNLAAFLHMLKVVHPERYRTIVETIRMVAPFFDDFDLRPSPLNQEKIQLEWRQRESEGYFNASSLSDGTLRFMCLTALLLQPDLPSTIVIDEPELGLHPYAITVLAGMLQSAAERVTVVVSTQSVPLVNQFEPEDLVIVDRDADEGQSLFNRLPAAATSQWLDEYGLGDLWEKNLLGGRPQR